MPSYSIADATSDVECILRDFQCSFVCDNWMNVSNFQHSILGSNSSIPQDLPSICRNVSDHNNSMKYLRFVTDTLTCVNPTVAPQDESLGKVVRDIMTTAAFDITKPLNQGEFLDQIPFAVSVAEIVENNSILRDICDSEITMKQLQKDIERDQLVIDGKRMIGSNDGIDSCLLAVGDAIDSCLASCFLPSLGAALREEAARAILTAVSRTNSGGVALHTLRSITGEQNKGEKRRETGDGSKSLGKRASACMKEGECITSCVCVCVFYGDCLDLNSTPSVTADCHYNTNKIICLHFLHMNSPASSAVLLSCPPFRHGASDALPALHTGGQLAGEDLGGALLSPARWHYLCCPRLSSSSWSATQGTTGTTGAEGAE